MASFIYYVQRCDHQHYTDRRGRTRILSAYATLELANKEASNTLHSIRHKEDTNRLACIEEDKVQKDGYYCGSVRLCQDDTPTGIDTCVVSVKKMRLQGGVVQIPEKKSAVARPALREQLAPSSVAGRGRNTSGISPDRVRLNALSKHGAKNDTKATIEPESLIISKTELNDWIKRRPLTPTRDAENINVPKYVGEFEEFLQAETASTGMKRKRTSETQSRSAGSRHDPITL